MRLSRRLKLTGCSDRLEASQAKSEQKEISNCELRLKTALLPSTALWGCERLTAWSVLLFASLTFNRTFAACTCSPEQLLLGHGVPGLTCCS